jgi:hypothetical protein
VGNGEEGYEKILDVFKNNKMGSFARVIVVNPLHDKLPRLVLVVCCTCNKAVFVKLIHFRVSFLNLV